MKNTKRASRRCKTQTYCDRQIRLNNIFLKEQPSPNRAGRLRTLSWRTCGRKKCQRCCCIRRHQWLSENDKLTRQERRINDHHKQTLTELYENSIIDDEAIG